jgi:hypothetical protein
MEQLKQLKHTTVMQYTSRKAWNAVLKRSDEFRLDAAGIFRAVGNGAFFFHASYSFDKKLAIQALIDIEAIDLTPPAAYRQIMGGC